MKLIRIKRKTKILIPGLVAGCLAIATALAQDSNNEWVAPVRAAKKKNPIQADGASLEKGKALYVKECLSCHGPAGRGDGPAVKDLEKKPEDLSAKKVLDQSDGAIFWKLTEGKKPMPSYEKTFTEDDRWNAINYMRTLTPK